MKTKMHLAFDLSWAHTDGRWRTPGSWTGRTFPDLSIYKEIVSIAERGRLDLIFFGDTAGVNDTWEGTSDTSVKWGLNYPRLDMSPYIGVLAQHCKNVGFGLTYSSTYLPPYYVARLLNSLDHITGGRIAFNVIASTNPGGAANYGFDKLMEHDARYERMEEFIDICKRLWASAEPDAFIWDRESGIVADPKKVRALNHAGKFFKVRGPLQCQPSPQGRPVLIQAGSSPRGIRASANFADYIFGVGSRARKVKHRADLDAALVVNGRDPSQIGILWDIILVIEETEAEAKRRKEHVLNLLPQDAVGAWMSGMVGYDFSKIPARFKLNDLNQEIIASQASPVLFTTMMAAKVGDNTEITREEFFERARSAATSYDHTFAGTAKQVADYLEEEFEATGERGGFMIAHPISTPRDLLNVTDYLVPELQRRGRFRKEYESHLLKENLRIRD
jgi:FMN-dependent oxidoreductase (nitrilotriacetate monooxygenase family)